MTLGVVMAVHAGVAPEHLDRALASLAAQTRPADDVVVIEDGDVGSGLTAVLDAHGVRRIRVPAGGAGPARQAGLEALTTRWFAIADSDDVSAPDRFASQLARLEGGDVAAVGAAMAEFEGSEDRVVGLRRLPGDHAGIARLARINNPVNHPTLMAERQVVLDAGGYRDLPWLEDYDLMVRLVGSGARLANLPEPLVLFRSSAAQRARRAPRGVWRSELRLQRTLRAVGLVGPIGVARNLVVRTAYRLLPAPLMGRVYRRIFLRRA